MKKILFVAKIILAIAMVLVAAYSLSPFGVFVDLFIGTMLMLIGVALGVCLERRHRRAFFITSLLSFFFTISFYFFPFIPHIQHFFGGLSVYFACALVFGINKIEVTKKMC